MLSRIPLSRIPRRLAALHVLVLCLSVSACTPADYWPPSPATVLLWWPIVTAVISLFYNYLDGIPRVHAFLSMLVKAGVDLPAILDDVKRLFTGQSVQAQRAAKLRPLVPPLPVLCLGLICAALMACSATQTSASLKLGKDTLVCVLNHSTDPPEKIAFECGVGDVNDVVALIDAHRAAEMREGYVLRPDGGR